MAEVYLYDTSLSPLPSTTSGLLVDVFDDVGRFVASYSPAHNGVGFGVTVHDPDCHDLYIHNGGRHAPTTVQRLNGNQSYRVDLILLPLPLSAAIGGTTAASNIPILSTFLSHQISTGHWNSDETAAVIATIEFVHHATMKTATDSNRSMLIHSATQRLDSLGITMT